MQISLTQISPHFSSCLDKNFVSRHNPAKKYSNRPVLLNFLAGLSAVLFSASGYCVSLQEISDLVYNGTPNLALSTLDYHQPNIIENRQSWMDWEKQRIAMLQKRSQWETIVVRMQDLPNGVPKEFLHWELTQGVYAYLALGKGKDARLLIQRLIWGKFGDLSFATLIKVRRLVINSYLMEGRAKESYDALISYQRDYPNEIKKHQDDEWIMDQARVFLLASRPAEASEILQRQPIKDAEPLILLAKLRNKEEIPVMVIKAATQLVNQTKKNQIKAKLWAVIAEAASMKFAFIRQADALEKSLSLIGDKALIIGLYAANGDALWSVYQRLGKAMGRQARLKLDSNQEAWFAEAERLERLHRVRTKGTYAYLAINSKSKKTRILSHQRLAAVLVASKQDRILLRALYMESKYFPTLSKVPTAVRHIMVGQALRKDDIKLASTLLRGLNTAPPTVKKLDWILQRARVHILAGNHQRGVEVLLNMFQSEKLSTEQVDRLSHVLFDLQAMGQHEAVYPLFQIVLSQLHDSRRKREILYWMADSMEAMGEYTEAARLYLKSAGLVNRKAMDLWAQSARFRAGEMLAKAGLDSDAKKIYQSLVKVSTEPSQLARLERNLQQLHFVKD